MFCIVNVKRTWVNYGKDRNWMSESECLAEEFLYHSVQVRTINNLPRIEVKTREKIRIIS